MIPVESPFKTYTGLNGLPLNNGYVYFGVKDLNPITNPVTVYWDAAGTQPAAQPLRTVNGYIMRAGTPANVYVAGSYSELVKNSAGRQVFYARNSEDFSISAIIISFLASLALSTGASLIGFIALALGAVPRTVESKLRDHINGADFGIVGDGSDESTRVQNFLNAVSGKSGEMPPGLMIRCNSTVYIKGDGTKIRWNGSTINSYALGVAVDFSLVGGTRYCYNVDIQDFSINAYGAGSYAFAPRTSYSTFRRVSVGLPLVNIGGRGIVLYGDEATGTGPYYNSFLTCDVQSSSLCLDHIGFSFVSVAPSFNRAPNCNTLIGCRAGQCFQDFNIKGNGNVLINPIAEGVVGAGTGYTFEATTLTNCNQNHIFGGYLEGQLVGISFSANSSNNMVTGMYGTGVTTWKVDAGVNNMVHTAIGSWAMPTGINFPTLSTDPSALDYYGEGTWTPVPTNVTTNSGAPVWSGYYTRIGNTVTATIKMTGGNITINAGTSQVTLPFAATQIDWGTFGDNLATLLGGRLASYAGQAYFSTAMTSSGVGGTITYRV